MANRFSRSPGGAGTRAVDKDATRRRVVRPPCAMRFFGHGYANIFEDATGLRANEIAYEQGEIDFSAGLVTSRRENCRDNKRNRTYKLLLQDVARPK